MVLIPEEHVASEGGHIRIKDQTVLCTVMGMISSNPLAFPSMDASMDGAEKFYGCMLHAQTTSQTILQHTILLLDSKAVTRFKGCPIQFITDLGTENGIAAGIHTYFKDNPDKHRYVSSPRNPRIESWWSFLRRSTTSW